MVGEAPAPARGEAIGLPLPLALPLARGDALARGEAAIGLPPIGLPRPSPPAARAATSGLRDEEEEVSR